MRKETALVAVVALIVFGTVGFIYSFAIPAMRPVHFPHIVEATVRDNQLHQDRKLDAQETKQLNLWLATHGRHWAPLTSPTPSRGDFVIKGVTTMGSELDLAVWTGSGDPTWRHVVVTRPSPGSGFKSKSLTQKEWSTLAVLLR